MKELHEKWGQQLLGFSLELLAGYAIFPRHLLQLMAKYFEFDRLLFFPYQSLDGSREYSGRRDALNNFSTLNIALSAMREYSRHYYKLDPFSHRNIPEGLKKKRVVLIEDIMPLEEYERTEYHADYYATLDIYYQACIFLKENDRNVATLNIYRSKREGPFSASERMLFEYISVLISAQYAIAFRFSTNMMTQEAFRLFYNSLNMGVIMLNQQLIVLKANAKAHEYCNLLLQSTARGDTSFQRSRYSIEDENNLVQEAVNNIGIQLSGDSGRVVESRILDDFVFYYNSFLFTNIYGNVETRHFIFIIRKKRNNDVAVHNKYDKLTQRETEIVNLVAQGYTNEKISKSLHVSIYTVRTHISNIYKKFNVNNKVDLLLFLNRIHEE